MVNAHFYRNFITLGDDIMLDALADNSYEVIGFQRDHGKANFSDPKDYNWGKVIKNFKPVATGFREQAIKDQQDALKELEKAKNGNSNDSAVMTSVAYFALAVAASTTLCF